MGYLVIEVCNRQISTVKAATLKDAQEAMKQMVNEAIESDHDTFEIGKTSAWANVALDDFQYNWEVVAI